MLTTSHKLSFRNGTRGVRKAKSRPIKPQAPAKTPHISLLMALAIHCDDLIQTGVVKDQTDLAALAHVTRGRLSQIMSLLCLAPDIQEAILFFAPQASRKQPINEPKLRAMTGKFSWESQRKVWYRIIPSDSAVDR